MIRPKRAAGLILVLAIACGGDTAGAEAFCAAARDLTGVTPGDREATLDTVERMRAEAPDEIAESMNIFADAMTEAVETGDQAILERPEVQDAGDDMDTYLDENCEPPEDQ